LGRYRAHEGATTLKLVRRVGEGLGGRNSIEKRRKSPQKGKMHADPARYGPWESEGGRGPTRLWGRKEN